jgi:hypothetical protein
MTVTATLTPDSLVTAPRDALDKLFRESPAGPIPAGKARGTAIVLPGRTVDRALAALVRAFIWKGKVFAPQTQDLRNLIGPFGFRVIRAKVYQDESWFSKGPAIILDYSKTSFVARYIRDEIRQISAGVYLGQVYWGKRRICLFMLEFPAGATA